MRINSNRTVNGTSTRTHNFNSRPSQTSGDRFTRSNSNNLNLMNPNMVSRSKRGPAFDPYALAKGALAGKKMDASVLASRLLLRDPAYLSDVERQQYNQIVARLKRGDARLPKVLINALKRGTGDFEIGQYANSESDKRQKGVRQALESIARNGNVKAREALREKAESSRHLDFHAHLAGAGEHLDKKDYAVLANAYKPEAQEYSKGAYKVKQQVEKAVSEGSRPAIDGILNTVENEKTKDYQSHKLYTLLAKEAKHLKPEDLTRIAGQKDPKRLDTLVAAATTEKPAENSLKALRDAMGENKKLPHTAHKALLEWAGKTKDEGRFSQVADLVLNGPVTDKKLKKRAIDALSARAAKGDKKAIAYLRDYKAYGENKASVESGLDKAARGGDMAGIAHVTGGLAKTQGYEDLSTSLETMSLRKDDLGTKQVSALDHVMETQYPNDPDYAKAAEVLGSATTSKDKGTSKAAINSLLGRVGTLDDKGNDHAARALAAAVNKLDDKALATLAKNPNKDAINTLLQAKDLKPEQRRRLFGLMQDKLEDYGDKGKEVYRAAGAWAKDLGTAEIARLGKVRGTNQKSAVKVLLQAAAKQKNPQLGRQALKAIADGGIRPGSPEWDKFVGLLSNKGTAELKAGADKKLARSPLSDQRLSQVNDNFQKLLGERIKEAPEGSRLHKLGQFMRVQAMAADSKNEYAGEIDKEQLKKKYEKFITDPKVTADLEKIRQDAITKTFGSGGRKQVVADSARYLKSKTFQQRLDLMPEDQRAAEIQKELGRLRTLSPEKAKEVEKALSSRVEQGAMNMLSGVPEEDREQGIEKALLAAQNEGLATGIKTAKNGGKMAKYLSKAVEVANKPKFAKMKGGDRLKAALTELARTQRLDPALKGKALRLIDGLTESGKLGTFLAGSGVAAMALRGVPQNSKEALKTSADLLSVIGDSEAILKSGRAVGALKFSNKALEASKFLKLAKIAGPLGSAISGTLDGMGAVKAYQKGDYWEMAGKGASALGGGAMATGGVMLLTPAAPIGAVLVLGGAVLSVGGTLVDWFGGRDDTQDMLHDLGVWKG